MRTTKRFTPTVIARFLKEGRGQGTHADFIPWHRVSRGDPASSGRSHLLMWKCRLRELLSDGELNEQLFATMLPDLDDSLEQYRLTPEPSVHLRTAYGDRGGDELFPGTLELATQLGIKHPRLHAGEAVESWRFTTDLVLVFKPKSGLRRILALAFKPVDFAQSPRKRALLQVEREYWNRRGVQWLLITPAEFDFSTAMTLRRVAPWALGDEVPAASRAIAVQLARRSPWMSLTTLLEQLAEVLGSMDLAQRALWQAVWIGDLPIDLRRGWRPHLPLQLVSSEQFDEFNPIASGRTACV